MATDTTTHPPRVGDRTGERAGTTQSWNSRVGIITGKLIAAVAAGDRARSADVILEGIYAEAGRMVRESEIRSRPHVARWTATSATAVYVRYALPGPDWTLLGSEMPVGSGRVDLAWEQPDGTVVFDELKLSLVPDRDWAAGPISLQTRRYASAGASRYGERFRGVRLIRLAAPSFSTLVRHDLPEIPLGGTDLWFGPAHLKTGIVR